MSQYDVVDNPLPRARHAFPLLVILQSELADTGRDRIVAPLVPRERMPGAVGTLTPVVTVERVDYVLLVPRMTAVAAADLREARGDVKSYRDQIVTAIDFLFLGV